VMLPIQPIGLPIGTVQLPPDPTAIIVSTAVRGLDV